MIFPSPLATVGGSQVTVANPKDFTRTADHAIVYNPGASVVYLSAWRSDTAAGGAGARVGTYAVGPGASFTLPLGLNMGDDDLVLQANANVDATGAPSGNLEITIGWSH